MVVGGASGWVCFPYLPVCLGTASLNPVFFSFLFLFFFFFSFLPSFPLSFFLSEPPMAYGSSQARGLSELQLPAYATARATRDPSHICNLHHSSRQCQIF